MTYSINKGVSVIYLKGTITNCAELISFIKIHSYSFDVKIIGNGFAFQNCSIRLISDRSNYTVYFLDVHFQNSTIDTTNVTVVFSNSTLDSFQIHDRSDVGKKRHIDIRMYHCLFMCSNPKHGIDLHGHSIFQFYSIQTTFQSCNFNLRVQEIMFVMENSQVLNINVLSFFQVPSVIFFYRICI